MNERWDVVVIGAGPAGLAAVVAARDRGANACLVEREDRPGGILKQCIHDGFGLLRYQSRLTGPEYAHRELSQVRARQIPILTGVFLLAIRRDDRRFTLTLQCPRRGVFELTASSLVAATGCRERTARQVFIHGDRPAGVYPAGTAQRLLNIEGLLPGRRCVVLGSGDVGLIVARRLTLEGASVEGVYEIKPEPSGLDRNLAQCLDDFHIPLHLCATVSRIHGRGRVSGVTVCRVDNRLRPIADTARLVPCDTLIVSVGLIPENEILRGLGLEFDPRTGGPLVDQTLQTSLPGLFSCGNSLQVHDLVDHVSEGGEIAGAAAADHAAGRLPAMPAMPAVEVRAAGELRQVVPQRLNPALPGRVVLWFRARRTLEAAALTAGWAGKSAPIGEYASLRPPEMQRFTLEYSGEPDHLTLELREVSGDARENGVRAVPA